MTSFGLLIVGCWIGFALGLLFAGTAGMLSRKESLSARLQEKDGFDTDGGMRGAGQLAGRI